jgi:hypothetical protein
MWFFKCTLGNVNIWGVWLPMAFTSSTLWYYPSLPWSQTLNFLDSLSTGSFGKNMNSRITSVIWIIDFISCDVVSWHKFLEIKKMLLHFRYYDFFQLSKTNSIKLSQTQGLMMLPQSPELYVTSIFNLYPTLWHNHIIASYIVKGKFQSFLLCETIM